MSILLKNATYIDWESLKFSQTHILVEEGLNGNISLLDDITGVQADTILDVKGKFVTKSFAVGHHHAYSALSRGMPAPAKSPANFYEVLQYIWWNLDKALDKEMIEASALATAVASAKAGSTFVIDHHASPNFIEGSLEIMAEAFDKVGVSHLLCYEITDRDGLDKAQQGLDETEKYLQNRQALVGLHASFTVGNDTLKKSVDLMEKYNSGIHIHVAEDSYDQEHSLKNYDKRVVQRLDDFNVLESSKTILGHCLHLDDVEKKIIKNSKAYVVQNTESNLNNNVGYFNAEGLGDRLILGTDGMHSDMLRSAQAAFFVGQGFDNITYPSSYERFRNTHRYLAKNNFTGDSANNLVVLDYDSPTEMHENNFLGHFIFGLRAKHVKHVISNGELIVKDNLLQKVNEAEIQDFTKEQAKRLWSRL
jgi:cytosine/adenosine deaminase-related metal-dependent hydrolase